MRRERPTHACSTVNWFSSLIAHPFSVMKIGFWYRSYR